MKLNRVVVTGYGLTSPIGLALRKEKLVLGQSLSLTTVNLLFIMLLRFKIFLLINTSLKKTLTVLIIIHCMLFMLQRKL